MQIGAGSLLGEFVIYCSLTHITGRGSHGLGYGHIDDIYVTARVFQLTSGTNGRNHLTK